MKKKRYGKFNGRVVVDGRKQRSYIDSDIVASPTIYLESLLTMLIIKAYAGSDVAISDVCVGGGSYFRRYQSLS